MLMQMKRYYKRRNSQDFGESESAHKFYKHPSYELKKHIKEVSNSVLQ